MLSPETTETAHYWQSNYKFTPFPHHGKAFWEKQPQKNFQLHAARSPGRGHFLYKIAHFNVSHGQDKVLPWRRQTFAMAMKKFRLRHEKRENRLSFCLITVR